jgi:hypothetical protein
MANGDVVKDEAQELQDRDRNLEERILGAKDATLRLWERNRHLQERMGRLERRVQFVTWLAVAFFAVSVGLFAIIGQYQIPLLRGQIAGLHGTLRPLQDRLAEFERTAQAREEKLETLAENGEKKIARAETDLMESMKRMAPEILATVFQNSLYVDPDGNIGIGTVKPAAQLHVVGNLLGAAKGPANQALRIAVGNVSPETIRWVQYNDGGLYVDVDTASAGFSSTPYYFTSLGGHTNNALAQGVTSIYRPTAEGFRVYVNYPDLTVAKAKAWGWYVNWIAIGK